MWLRGPDLHRRPSGYEPDELLLLHRRMKLDQARPTRLARS